MCALFGFLDYKGKVSHAVLTKLIRNLSIACEERGTDATGISYVENNSIKIFKKAKPAHRLRLYFPYGTKCVIGHTRLTTQGNQNFNQNNHPFHGYADKEFSLAHNGVLYNDKLLRNQYQLPETNIETDSYIAVQMIEYQKKLNFESLKFMAEQIQGSFMLSVLSSENKLYLIKGSNPICLLNFYELGIYVYASTQSIMMRAISKLNLGKYRVIPMNEGEIFEINSAGTIMKYTFDIKDEFDYISLCYSRYYNSKYEYENEDYELDELLETCVDMGYDEDDILEMLDLGYTVKEIAEMICCYEDEI